MFYQVVRLASIPVFAAWFRLGRRGAAHVPADGPVLVAANHHSYLDPAVLGSTCPRRLDFLISADVWSVPGMNLFYQLMGSIPVDTSGRPTRTAIRTALARLEAGRAIGIFPEGGRVEPGRESAALAGVALLARRSGAPVVPAGIRGAERAMPRGVAVPRPVKVEVAYGAPLRWADFGARGEDRRADLEFTDALMRRIRSLAAGTPA